MGFLGGTGFQPVQIKTHRLEAGATQEGQTVPENLVTQEGSALESAIGGNSLPYIIRS